MIGTPPALVDAAKAIVAVVLPGTAPLIVGAPGTVAGVTLFEGIEGTLSPTALVAITVQVTTVPLLRLLTTIGEAAPLELCVPQVAV